jgi:hypothetical protein
MNNLYEFLVAIFPKNVNFDTPEEVWTNFAIIALAVILSIICICRMNVLDQNKHLFIVRMRYLILFTGSIGTVLAPWAFLNNHLAGALILTGSTVIYMLLSVSQWKDGAPFYTQITWNKLYEEKKYDARFCDTCLAMGTDTHSMWCKLRRCIYMVKYIFRGNNGDNL